jgi:hypothetical protein
MGKCVEMWQLVKLRQKEDNIMVLMEIGYGDQRWVKLAAMCQWLY